MPLFRQPGLIWSSAVSLDDHHPSVSRALCAVRLGRVEEQPETKPEVFFSFGGGGGQGKKRHLDLTFISGADPLSGANSPRSWLWNREWLYACLLQSSSYKIPFNFSRGLKGRLERHVHAYLQ